MLCRLLTFDHPKLLDYMRILILGLLGFILYRLIFKPVREGYLDKSKPRILKKKPKKSPKKKRKDIEYTDYEEID